MMYIALRFGKLHHHFLKLLRLPRVLAVGNATADLSPRFGKES